LRFIPLPSQVRPEDRHYVEIVPNGTAEVVTKRSAGEKVDQARKRYQRVVWVQDAELLRSVPVTLGLIENQFAELLTGELSEGQAIITGTESGHAAR